MTLWCAMRWRTPVRYRAHGALTACKGCLKIGGVYCLLQFVEVAKHLVRQLMLLLLMHRLNELEERVMRLAARESALGYPV